MSSTNKPSHWCRQLDVRNRLVAGSACLVLLAAAYILAPVIDYGPTVCPTRLIFGVPCPSCGITRAVCAAARGHLRLSLSLHLFGPLVVVALAVLGPALIAEALAQRPFPLLRRVLRSYTLGLILIAALFAYYVVRLVLWGTSGVLADPMSGSAVGTVVREAVRWFG